MPAITVRNANFALYRSFKKAFPVINIGGVDVYSNQLNLYANGQIIEGGTGKRFLNKLGFDTEVLKGQDYTGIQRLYITFDSQKYNYEVMPLGDLLMHTSAYFNPDDIFSIKITYGGASLRYFTDHQAILNDINYLIAKLDADPVRFYAGVEQLTFETMEYNNFDNGTQNYTSIVSPLSIATENYKAEAFALLDDGTHFERVNVRGVQYKTIDTQFDGKLVDEVSFIFDYRVKIKPANTNTQLIQRLNTVSQSILLGMKAPIIGYSAISSSPIQDALISFQAYDNTVFYGSYLRVSAVSSMKKKDFAKLIMKTIKVGYDEEPVKWYKKVLSVIVIIAALIVAFYAPFTAGSISIANLGYASIMLTVGMYGISMLGGKSNLGSYGRFMAKAAQILGIAAAILGAVAAIRALSTSYMAGTTSARQVVAGASAVNNIYSVYNNLTSQEIVPEEEHNTDVITANDLTNYKSIITDNDAITLMNIQMESNFGLNKTNILINNQSR